MNLNSTKNRLRSGLFANLLLKRFLLFLPLCLFLNNAKAQTITQGTGPICAGGFHTGFSITSGYVVNHWLVSTNTGSYTIQSSSSTSCTVQFHTAGNYDVIAVMNSKTVDLEVVAYAQVTPAFSIVSNYGTFNICKGTPNPTYSVNITDLSSLTAPITYAWSLDGNYQTNTATYTTNINNSLGAHTVSCMITCGNTCAVPGQSSITANVYPKNIALASSASATGNVVCQNTAVTLTASGTPATYYWSPATGLNTTSGAQVIATPQATTTYSVYGVTANCTTDTKTPHHEKTLTAYRYFQYPIHTRLRASPGTCAGKGYHPLLDHPWRKYLAHQPKLV